MGLGWHQNWSGHFGEEKNLLHLPEFEPRTIQPVAQFLFRRRMRYNKDLLLLVMKANEMHYFSNFI
jgi:hypothetical protein